MTQTQQRIVPGKMMKIVTTSGLVPRIEVEVYMPAYKTPKPSREASEGEESENLPKLQNRKHEVNGE